MGNNEEKIDVSVGDVDLAFVVNRASYNKYINSITPKDKVAPSHNFLMTTVADECKVALKDILAKKPGSEVQIAGAVLEAYTPDLDIVVKRSSSAQSD